MVVSTAAVAFGGTERLADDRRRRSASLANDVFGSDWLGKIVIIAVLTSARGVDADDDPPDRADDAVDGAREGAAATFG